MPIHAPSPRWHLLWRLTGLVLLIVAANFAGGWVVEALEFEIRPSNEDFVHRTIMISAVAYSILMAIPFVPGVEIALTLIAMLGPGIVFLLYVCTLVGLLMSFFIGRIVPLKKLIRTLEELHLFRASHLLAAIEPMSMQDRLGFLVAKAPNRFVPLLLRHRYVALAVVLNLPGNIVIGGGGGIALMAGVSRLYSIPGFLLTIALAVAPVPIAVLAFGSGFLRG